MEVDKWKELATKAAAVAILADGMHKEAVSKSTTVEASSTPKRSKHGKRSKGKRRRDERSSGKEQGEKRSASRRERRESQQTRMAETDATPMVDKVSVTVTSTPGRDSGVEMTSPPEFSPELLQVQTMSTGSSPALLSPGSEFAAGSSTGLLSPGSDGEERMIVVESEPVIRTDVVRESDRNEEEELPEEGLAKNLLSKFQNMEIEARVSKQKEHRPSGVASRSVGPVIQHNKRTVDASHFINPESDEEDFGAHGGVYESQPVVREDVAKEDQRNDEEELPPAGLTKNLLSAFKDLQRSGQNTPVEKPRQLSRANSTASSIADALSMYSEGSGATSENSPIVRENIVREEDNNEIEHLPAQGTTKNLLSMFSKVADDTKKMSVNLHKPSGTGCKQWKSSRPPVMTRPASKPKPSPASQEQVADKEIVREEPGVVLEDELPKSGFAKGLLNKFKNIEDAAPASSKVIKQAWCADIVKARRNSTSSDKGELSSTSQVTVHTTASGSSATNTESCTDQTEQTEQTDSVTVDTEYECSEIETVIVTESSNMVEETLEVSESVTISTNTVRKQEETISKIASSQSMPSAMSRFLQMENEKPKTVEHTPSQAARKPTPTPMGRKL